MPKNFGVGATAIIVLAIGALSLSLVAQPGYQPSPENLKTRQWFEQARFGMFIHWGIYSALGDGEWVMQVRNIPGPQYEQSSTPRSSTPPSGFPWPNKQACATSS